MVYWLPAAHTHQTGTRMVQMVGRDTSTLRGHPANKIQKKVRWHLRHSMQNTRAAPWCWLRERVDAPVGPRSLCFLRGQQTEVIAPPNGFFCLNVCPRAKQSTADQSNCKTNPTTYAGNDARRQCWPVILHCVVPTALSQKLNL